MSNPVYNVRAKGVVHKLIAETAKELAYTVYEEMAHTDQFYKTWPNNHLFVAARWQSFIQTARTHLAELLHPDNHHKTDENQRQEIYEALKLNAAVNPALDNAFKLN